MALFYLSQTTAESSVNFYHVSQRLNSSTATAMNTKGEPNTRGAESVQVSQQWGRKFLHHRSVTFTCLEQNVGSLSPYGQSESKKNKSSAYSKVD